jgi:polyribonucleotide nucleotidyltransferase
MLEGEAREVAEDVLVDAIQCGLDELAAVIDLQDKMREAIGQPKRVIEPPKVDEALALRIKELALSGLQQAYVTPGKHDRYAQLDALRDAVLRRLQKKMRHRRRRPGIFEDLERQVLRGMILGQKKRIDGRAYDEIRPIWSETGILPRAHGSALFTRGETQALAS